MSQWLAKTNAPCCEVSAIAEHLVFVASQYYSLVWQTDEQTALRRKERAGIMLAKANDGN